MVAKAWNLRVKGDFTPLVSEELFDRVQDVLSGRGWATTPHKRQNEAFPMRGKSALQCLQRSCDWSQVNGEGRTAIP